MNAIQEKIQTRTIAKIHKAVDVADIELMESANSTIEQHKVDNFDHVSDLADLGFVNSGVVSDYQKSSSIRVIGLKLAEKVAYYKSTYPFLKFLTEDKFNEICKKYGLIYAPVTHYLKDVPKKNIRDIKNAQELKKGDVLEDSFKILPPTSIYRSSTDRAQKWLFSTEFEGRGGSTNNYDISKLCPYGNNEISFENNFDYEKIDRSGLFIAAPKSHFDLKDLKKGEQGYFKTKKIIQPKDPIVFRYVRGGIQVLTKWGLEANEPELANAIDN